MFSLYTSHSVALVTFCILGVVLTEDIDLSSLPKKVKRDIPLDRVVTFPPKIISKLQEEIAYKVGGEGVGEEIELPCIAQGDPRPTYKWFHNGVQIDLDSDDPRTDIKMVPGVGTIIIEVPNERHEGVYQCWAENVHGTALSSKAHLREASYEPFETVREPFVHYPELGDFVMLQCHPPDSYPSGDIYWGESSKNTKLMPIETNDRIALDYEGHLYIANVIPEDHREGRHYVCVVENVVLRSLIQGDDQVIQPFDYPATPSYRAPKKEWTSDKNAVAIKGLRKKMKCIFSGYPTPEVSWMRIDGGEDDRYRPSDDGLEIIFDEIDYPDAGRYRCSASNDEGVPPMFEDFHLTVESRPFFVHQPTNINKAEEEDAVIRCEAGGMPPPSVSWSINGVPAADLDPDPRRTVAANAIYYRNLTKTDSHVIQCNISNAHGYEFANGYLNVLAEPPTWVEIPQDVKASQFSDAELVCRVFGAPNPRIVWKKDDEVIDVGADSHFTLHENGYLLIENVQVTDEGRYECHASNKFGQIYAPCTLHVRAATNITSEPEDQVVNASSDVVFHCEAETDHRMENQLEIEWRKNNIPINFQETKRFRYNTNDHSLTIVDASVEDTADYTCVADNGLDSDSLTSKLIVRARPDPPTNVHLGDCQSRVVDVFWEASNDNNEEIIEYIVYYNTSFDEENTFHESLVVDGRSLSGRVELTPWANFTFHVVARNSLGVSDRSEFTTLCKTPAYKPLRHPRGVCTESRGPNELVIVWEPIPRIEHNGPNFKYIVGYKQTDRNGDFIEEHVNDWEQGELVIGGQDTFVKYEIYVSAANNIGTGSTRYLKHMYGYSGEGEPKDSPKNLRIDEDSLNATSAIFIWDPIDQDSSVIQGLFTGYEIHYWPKGKPEETRIHEVPVTPGEFCEPVDPGRDHSNRGDRRKRQASGVDSTHILNLWPFSDVEAGILAKNTRHSGQLSSPPFSLRTPEGVPGVPGLFEITETGSHHLRLAWQPPLSPNGILTGFTIGYQKANDATAPMIKQEVIDPTKRAIKLDGLERNTPYRLYIWAQTVKGLGESYFIEGRTLDENLPDVPAFASFETGESSVNVSWLPVEKGKEPTNPGSDYYLEYRKSGDDNADWETAEPEDDQMWVNVTGLDHGELYEFRIVAVNGAGGEKKSRPVKIRIGPQQEKRENPGQQVEHIARAGWFIGMMCAIIFLLLILLIVCLIKRNRGGKYPVYEKEKLRAQDPNYPNRDDEEGGFGEYTRTPSKVPYMELKSDEPDYKKSSGSLESGGLGSVNGSEVDSMAEYDQMDPSKFNEDGSFIGQYGGKTKKEEKEPDTASPSALSTFV